ncbi:MAG: dual specificity protein phosphatase family protein [Deltaproteobacteria bacterium]|nr:dual specificity protein phosphatase family protein [Deltaproteobacteria bacterium]
MYSPIYWIPESRLGRLAVTPRPRGGEWLDDEVIAWRDAGVATVVSLLTHPEAAELLLEEEAARCRANGIAWISFPIPDRQVPASLDDTRKLVAQIADVLRQGLGVIIHCRMGIGRSALIAASVLVSQGIGVQEAFAAISKARGVGVPDTEEQRTWVAGFSGH